MRGFYYDIFLIFLTYGILGFLTYRLRLPRKNKSIGNDPDDGMGTSNQPIIPDLPEGVKWPEDLKEEVLL